MKRKPIATLVLATAILALAVAAGALAQSGPPPADATPGVTGISNVVLSGLDPVVADGYGMDMREFTWEPGSFITPHTHPAAFIICVQDGAVGFSIQSGAAVVTRGGTADSVAGAEPMAVGDEVVLEPRDCVAVDEEPRTIHTVWNAGNETAVTIETYLFARDEPGRTFVNAEGTPIPQ
jgi:quercetin dioxygenase-like cupin family protein